VRELGDEKRVAWEFPDVFLQFLKKSSLFFIGDDRVCGGKYGDPADVTQDAQLVSDRIFGSDGDEFGDSGGRSVEEAWEHRSDFFYVIGLLVLGKVDVVFDVRKGSDCAVAKNGEGFRFFVKEIVVDFQGAIVLDVFKESGGANALFEAFIGRFSALDRIVVALVFPSGIDDCCCGEHREEACENPDQAAFCSVRFRCPGA
ncbi:MAG: hypothetical protein RL069_2610, partial [Planctomycetota bacterium]